MPSKPGAAFKLEAFRTLNNSAFVGIFERTSFSDAVTTGSSSFKRDSWLFEHNTAGESKRFSIRMLN